MAVCLEKIQVLGQLTEFSLGSYVLGPQARASASQVVFPYQR